MLSGQRQPPRGWTRGRIAALVVVGGLVLMGPQLLALYTDWLWYVHDAGRVDVLTKRLSTSLGLGALGALVAFLAIWTTARLALRQAAVLSRPPTGFGDAAGVTVMDITLRFGGLVAALGATLLALFFGAFLSSRAPELWWYQAATTFGKKDPAFGHDLGFYVFQLPWISTIVGFLFAVSLLCLVVSAGLHAGVRGMAQVTGARVGAAAAVRHLSTLGGLTAILLGVRQWIGRFEALSDVGGQFAGPGHATWVSLSMQQGIAVLAVVVGIAILVNGCAGSPGVAAKVGLPVLVLAIVVGKIIVPSTVQRLVVEPNRLRVERPYAQRAIEMTRFAFGLDRFEVHDFAVKPQPTDEELAAASTTLDNMRMWDPQVLRRTIDGLQSLRPYYRFVDVDIDRYTIGGKPTMVMLSPRDIDTGGLSANARTWVNTRLQYTHGFGVVMTPVNAATATGQPVFWLKDFPVRSTVDIPLDQPRIYFSDFGPVSGSAYSIVGTKQEEFDYPAQDGQRSYKWTGKRGVPVSGGLAKLAFSMRLRDGNLLVSPNLTSSSRLLWRRDVRERVARLYPGIGFDSDPYIVLFEGRILWVMDGYVGSRSVPYSDRVMTPIGALNYIRNTLKLTIDAYSGDMNAYAIDESEPMLRAYRKIFPRAVRPASDIPKGLREHFRYGEDFFNAQSAALTQYHVTDPEAFLNNEDAWQLPTERGRLGQTEPMVPYYVLMRLPGEERDSFMLILPFTPREKNNMIGWMAAHCDPEEYGRVVLFRFPKDTQTPGPNQMESIFNQDREIAQVNRELNNEQSEIVPGNLLVIPIGSSILYVKPLFLQSRSQGIQPIPELKKVILALAGRVEIDDTYELALPKLLGQAPSAPSVVPAPAPTTAQPQPGEWPLVGEALALLDEAAEALKQGDLGRYAERVERARAVLRREAGR